MHRKLGDDWQETSLLTTTHTLLGQALSKRQDYIQDNAAILQGRVKEAGESLEQRVDEGECSLHRMF